MIVYIRDIQFFQANFLEKLRGGTVPSVELKENQVVGVAASCHGTGSSLLFLTFSHCQVGNSSWLEFGGCLNLFDDFQEMCFKVFLPLPSVSHNTLKRVST